MTGDAVRGAAGGVAAPSPQFTEDVAMANESAKKLAGLDVDTILFGHGDPVEGGGRTTLERFAATLGER